MPIRNPFVRRPGVVGPQDENLQPASSGADIAHPGFERVDTVGSKASSALSSIRSRRSQDTGEYKMSVVNDSGVYLPPSPTERETSWPKRYLSSRTSTDTRSSFGDIEHFPISRESFDSYRRSFDISARRPVVTADPAPRQSLDSTRFLRHPRSALGEHRFQRREPPTTEEEFEDVGLNDDGSARQQQKHDHHHHHHEQQPPAPRRRGFLSKFTTDSASTPQDTPLTPPATGGAAQTTMSMARFLPGRKRAQSGQSAELGAMPAADGHKSAFSEVGTPQDVMS